MGYFFPRFDPLEYLSEPVIERRVSLGETTLSHFAAAVKRSEITGISTANFGNRKHACRYRPGKFRNLTRCCRAFLDNAVS